MGRQLGLANGLASMAPPDLNSPMLATRKGVRLDAILTSAAIWHTLTLIKCNTHICPSARYHKAVSVVFGSAMQEGQECRGYVPILPNSGPREGSGEAATSDFVPLFGDPRECKGDIAIPRICGPLHSHGSPNKGTKSEVATSPLPSREPTNGRKCYVTPPSRGSPTPARGTKSEVAASPPPSMGPTNANVAVTQKFCPVVGPREGSGEVATSDFLSALIAGDPREWRDDVAFPPSFGLPGRQG